MSSNNCELKAAASKESRVVVSVNTTPAQIYSSVSVRSGQEATPVSISDSFIGDFASMNVSQTKQATVYEQNEDIELCPQKQNFYLLKKKSKKRALTRKQLRNEKFKPHFGMEDVSFISDSFRKMKEFSNLDFPEDLMRKIEGLFALFVNLKECDSYSHFASAVFLYVRDFYDGSITSQVMKYIKELLDDNIFQQQSNARNIPNWLHALRNVQDNWALVKSNKAFGQLSKLLGVLVTLGLCDASCLEFDIGGFQLLDKEILKRHMTATDVAEALFGTITYFVEGAYLCFQSGSIKPLLINDIAALELDEEYITLLSWWDLVKNGNLERIEGVSDSEFSHRVDVIINKLVVLLSSLKGLDKKLVADKLMKMKIIKTEMISIKISSGIRRAPFALEFFGDSNQGKTTFADQMVDLLLASASLPIEKEFRAALNPGDKFFSNWTSDKLVAILDDMANEKADFVEKPPTRAIIDICNNQMYYAPKAELDAKGKCFVEPEIVVVTTNVKDLDARAYSNNPYSIQRRMHLVYTVKCKPEFQRFENGVACGVDSSAVREYYTRDGVYTPPTVDDIWTITIERAVKPEQARVTGDYTPVVHNGKKMIDVSALEAIQYTIDIFHAHRDNQFCVVDGMRDRQHNLTICGVDGCKQIKGCCPHHVEFEQHFGLQTALTAKRIQRMFTRRIKTDSDTLLNRVEQAATNALYNKTTQFLDRWDWLCLVPSEYLENKHFVEFVNWYYRDEVEKQSSRFYWTIYTLVATIGFVNIYLCILLYIFIYVYCSIFKKSLTKKILIDELKERNDSLPLIIRSARDKYAKAICYTSVGLASLYILSKIYKGWKSLQQEHGSLEPKNEADIKQRDSEVDVWTPVTFRPLPLSEFSRDIDMDGLSSIIDKNLRYLSVDNGTNILMANMLFLRSNIVVVPNHYFDGVDALKITARRSEPDKTGGKFETLLHVSASYLIPDTDLRICYCPCGGTFRDLVKYFPTGPLNKLAFKMMWRSKEGGLIQAYGAGIPKLTNNGAQQFMGIEYTKLSMDTFAGLCGAVLLSEGKGNAVLGFHLGGIAGTPRGCAGTLCQKQILEAITHIESLEGVLLTGVASKFEPQCMGMNIMTNEKVHPKSPINFLPRESQFEYFGTCIGRSTYTSDVRKTPISDAIAKHCAQDNIWGKPKFNPEWFGWSTCLNNASHTGTALPHDILQTAVIDYKKPLLELVRSPYWRVMKPLTDHENLNGIPGCKFIDAIKLDTSVGFPLGGKKRRFIIEHEPTPDHPCNREFEPIIQDEINRVEALYLQGKRANTIAKACKKDEILPVAKEKCRIFYGNPIALTFLVRKYYLPVLRFLQMNPLVSECAVGINCYGPEWDTFYKHVSHFGMDRIFGGDYGKYDQKIPSQLLLAALRILIDIASECNYNDQDIIAMKAMAADLVYSFIAFNGDLVGLTTGTHISGNSLTAVMNGICGCLNLRSFFFTVYDRSEDFRKAVHIMTYGDDNIGSVSPDYPLFNIKDCSEFLGEHGQIYTMPDKTSELKSYLDEDEFEFLKRKSVYHPKLGVHVGALLEKSIFKSLHCYMRPKGAPLSPEQACAQNIDNALREWFGHGQEVYEERRLQMKQVAADCNITHLCEQLDWSYDDHIRNWHVKYSPDAIEQSEEQTPIYTVQSGIEDNEIAELQYIQAIADVPWQLRVKDFALLEFGEIDLCFQNTFDSRHCYLIVEVKMMATTVAKRKAKTQLKRWVEALHSLNPNVDIIAMSYVGMQWRVHHLIVDDVGLIYKNMREAKLTPCTFALTQAIENMPQPS